MDVIQRIAKNTSVLMIGQIIITILSVIISVAIARDFGDVIFGKYSYALAFTAFFTAFLDLGYDTLLIRDVARDKTKADKYMNNAFSIRVLFSIIIFIFIVITINFGEYPSDTKILLYLLGIYGIIISLSNVFKVTFRAFENMEYEAAIKIITNFIRVCLGLLMLIMGYGLIEIILMFLFTALLDLLVSFLICYKKFAKLKIEFDLDFFKKTIKIALPLGMLPVFSLIYVRIDTIMLEVMKGDAVVGWYNAAYNLTYGFKPIPQLFMTALLPLTSYYYVFSKDTLKNIYEKSFKYLLILGLPLALGLTLLGDKIILFFYGEQYTNSIIAIQILAWDVLLIFLYGCSAFILVSTDKQNKMMLIAASTALLNIVLNIFLIPTYSYVGSAIATIIAEGFLLASYIYLNGRYLHMIPIHKIVVKPIFASGAMGLFIYYFNNINLFLIIIISVIIYFVVLYLLNGFSKEDISLFRKIIKR
jgi:O-antigen/teichoic acid export membrane protein